MTALLDDDAAAGLVGVGAAHRLARVQVDGRRLRSHVTRGRDAVGVAVRTGQAGQRIAGGRLLADEVLPHRLLDEGSFSWPLSRVKSPRSPLKA